ncbi:hypothetical protein SAMN07250955_106240 [Arboricoccus pini]|uniref:Spermatogenesis-associated protein 20-like TRX domain-containing protein n=1 Tax=Arboricoccus pini TaxID=1963835 RepID=A0A212R9T9_9PROT|nr:thioredoxin domain-containing protein [Arboricoccus pini]SNB68775.1 hypothetical protein SAMN07250955_106240 [Arboricoccus pini]
MSNRLADATSPYLLQHAENPVAWQPWGAEALAEAKHRDVPILLSVGYAACHWCHVMAHESFEDPAIAQRMNALFVNIKVDREERPDLDGVFQHALAMLGEQGGWPLTMFLTPDGEPFWGGTYFPPTPRYGRPSLPQVLEHVARLWHEQRDKLLGQRDQLKAALIDLAAPGDGDIPAPALAIETAERLLQGFDARHGGLGGAPKFPQAPILSLLWTAGRGGGPLRATVLHTLRRISQGGIYDHLGGGFARYSVDSRWLVPHFEKMLYDNAQLLALLGEAWALTGERLFLERAEETVGWLQREMLVDGAFAASLDADSEGEEGKFYVWRQEEIEALLGERAAAFAALYGVTHEGNFEGASILHRLQAEGLPDAAAVPDLPALRQKLLVSRETRPRPARDDKILTDWNALAITGLVIAGRRCGRDDWISLAGRVFASIAGQAPDERYLVHVRRGTRAGNIAFLDDYAAMAEAATHLAMATGDLDYVAKAEAWLDTIDRDYCDEMGQFYQTLASSDGLLLRPRSAADGPVPPGVAMAARASTLLHSLTGKEGHGLRAEAIFKAFASEIKRSAYAHAAMLEALLRAADAFQIIVIGAADNAATRELRDIADRHAPPGAAFLQLAPGDNLPGGHPAAGKGLVGGAPAAYICAGATCSLPITTGAELRQQLDGWKREEAER